MPPIPEALRIALVHHRAGRLELAEEIYRRILAAEPEHAEALHLRGAIAHQRGDYAQALECLQRAIRADGTQAHYYNTLGETYRMLRRPADAVACYRQAIQLRPDHGEPYSNLGYVLEGMGRLDEAMLCYQQAVELQPDLAEAHNNLGNAYDHQGDLDAAMACYLRAMRLKPDFRVAYTNYLTDLRCHPGVTPAAMRDAYVEYDRQFAQPLRAAWKPHANSRELDRPLRLGFVSPSFCLGPDGSFVIQLLENLDREQFHVSCYSLYSLKTTVDRMTDRFRQASHAWLDCVGMSEPQLAERIRDDRIDILFDLLGHGPGNRLLAFALKPAPIQVAWIDSVGTTGLSAMDYLLGDRWLIPHECESDYVEQIMRMPDGHICYDPPDDAPPVGPLPARRNGRVTFAGFNRPSKIHSGVVKLWAEILRRLPDARLVLKHRMFHTESTARHYRELFAAEGIDASRLEFQGFSSREHYFEQYNQVDITLDPFPHSGSVTTCDSLWMGVPVITLPGASFASRQSLGHLSNIGFTETVCGSPDEYVAKAVALAGDLARLAEIREGLRPRMAASPLCDGPRFARNFAAMLRSVWRRWAAAEG